MRARGRPGAGPAPPSGPAERMSGVLTRERRAGTGQPQHPGLELTLAADDCP